MGFFSDCEREEKVHYELKLNPELGRKYQDILRKCFTESEIVKQENTTISWDLKHKYYHCIDRIKALLEIIDNGDGGIINVNLTELMHGQCLVKDLYNKTEELIKKLEKI
jgi:hypothetical protein